MEAKTEKILTAWLKHLEDTAIATATVKNDGANSIVILPSESIDADMLKLTESNASVIRQNLLTADVTDDNHAICMLLPVSMNRAAKGKTEISGCIAYKIESTLREALSAPPKDNHYQVILDVNDPDKTQVLLPVCMRLLEMDEKTVEKCRTQEGLRNFTSSITGSDDAATFHQVAESLIGYAIKKQKKANSIESRYIVLARLDLGKYEANLTKDLYGIINSREDFDCNAPAFKYLFPDKDPQSSPVVSCDKIWLGQAADYSYGVGQAHVLQTLQEPSESLIAVQGPPGTGKTALILGAIADTVCRRAYTLAAGGADHDTLMLITSDTNAAVDNVIDGLKQAVGKDAEWFWLNGGNKEKTDKDLSERMASFEEWLKSTSFDKQAYDDAGRNLRKLAEIILDQHKLSANKKEELKKTIASASTEHARWGKTEKELVEYIERLSQITANAPLVPAEFDVSAAEDVIYEAGLLRRQLQTIQKVMDKELQSIKKEPAKQERGFVAKILSVIGINKQAEVNHAPNQVALGIVAEETALFREFRTMVIEKLRKINEQAPTSTEDLERIVNRVNKMVDQHKSNQAAEKTLAIKIQELDTIKTKCTQTAAVITDAQKMLDSFVGFAESLRVNKHLVQTQHELFKASVAFLKLESLKRSTQLIQVLEQFRGDSRDRSEVINNQAKRTLLSLAYPVLASTSLSVRNLLPAGQSGPQQGILSLCIVDESGMIPLHKVFPAIWRAKKALVVGDLKQLNPVHQMSDQQIDAYHNHMRHLGFSDAEIGIWSPYESTAYHRASRCPADAGTMTGYALFLEEHRRCAAEIANTFKTIARYEMMDIHTPDRSSLNNERILRSLYGDNKIVGIDTIDDDNKNGERTDSGKESAAVVAKIGELIASGIDPAHIGVITPFRKQANRLTALLRGVLPKVYEQVGTVHTFQGKEYPVIVLSTVIGEGSNNANFADNMNLMNVAISRAKQQVLLVGDKKALSYKGRNLKVLAQHAHWAQLENIKHDLNLAHCPVNGRADMSDEPDVRRA